MIGETTLENKNRKSKKRRCNPGARTRRMSTNLISNPFDPISDDQLRTVLRAIQYRWLVRESAQSEWHLLAETYSMRQMSELVKAGRFVDIEVVEMSSASRDDSPRGQRRFSEARPNQLVVPNTAPTEQHIAERT